MEKVICVLLLMHLNLLKMKSSSLIGRKIICNYCVWMDVHYVSFVVLDYKACTDGVMRLQYRILMS